MLPNHLRNMTSGAQPDLDVGVTRIEIKQAGNQPFDRESAEAGHIQCGATPVAHCADSGFHAVQCGGQGGQ
ncbi:hypothetical protein D3C84_1206270 [compost metagenome]